MSEDQQILSTKRKKCEIMLTNTSKNKVTKQIPDIDNLHQDTAHCVQEQDSTIIAKGGSIQSAIFNSIDFIGDSGKVLDISKSMMEQADELGLGNFVAIRCCKGESMQYLHPRQLSIPIYELYPLLPSLKFCGVTTVSLVSPENQCLRWGKPYFGSLAPWDDIDQKCSITGLQMGPAQTYGYGAPQPAFVDNISDNITKKEDGTLENIHASHMVELLKEDGYVEPFARRVVCQLAQSYTKEKEGYARRRERRAWSLRQRGFNLEPTTRFY